MSLSSTFEMTFFSYPYIYKPYILLILTILMCAFRGRGNLQLDQRPLCYQFLPLNSWLYKQCRSICDRKMPPIRVATHRQTRTHTNEMAIAPKWHIVTKGACCRLAGWPDGYTESRLTDRQQSDPGRVSRWTHRLDVDVEESAICGWRHTLHHLRT